MPVPAGMLTTSRSRLTRVYATRSIAIHNAGMNSTPNASAIVASIASSRGEGERSSRRRRQQLEEEVSSQFVVLGQRRLDQHPQRRADRAAGFSGGAADLRMPCRLLHLGVGEQRLVQLLAGSQPG